MTLAADPRHVVVRMYNVGFGDAFLLVFPAERRPLRVLVDCGSHFMGAGPRPMAATVGQIIEDVTDEDGRARIDVVVGTHRHQDHVSGFEDPRWADVEVREVWMPWTEDPRDPRAARIRERQSSAAKALALAGAGVDETARTLAENALTNAAAMRTLHRGFAGAPRRRFLPQRDAVVEELRDTPLQAAGIDVQALGPARDEATIRDMDPPAGAGYLRLAAAGDEGAGRAPFDDSWTIPVAELEQDEQLAQLLLTPHQARRIREAGEIDAFAVAVALEQAVNGTSLVLRFAVGDACLVMAGDAQWGTWKRILDSAEASALVAGASFVKVGHHGSHNATPRRFVELLSAQDGGGGDLWAMVSTRPIRIWKHIPKPELLEALGDVTDQLARSDRGGGDAQPGFDAWTEDYIDARVPLRARRRARRKGGRR